MKFNIIALVSFCFVSWTCDKENPDISYGGPSLKDTVEITWNANVTCFHSDSVLWVNVGARNRFTFQRMPPLRLSLVMDLYYQPSCATPGLPEWVTSWDTLIVTDAASDNPLAVRCETSPYPGADSLRLTNVKFTSVSRWFP